MRIQVTQIRRDVWAWLRRQWFIVLLAVVFAGLGIVYTYTTPLFEASNETCHYLLAASLADGTAAQQPEELCQGALDQLGMQPPLYYWVGAALIRWVPVASDGAAYLPNPFASVDQPDARNNYNAVLHLESLASPPDGLSTRIHLLRLFSLVCSLSTIAGVYVIARRLAGERRDVVVGATALAAFTPGFLFMSASVGNRALVVALFTWTLVLAFDVASGRELSPHLPWTLGLFAGLAALTRNVGLLALLVVPAGYFVRARWRWVGLKWQESGGPLAISMGAALAGCGPWYVGQFAARVSVQQLLGQVTPAATGGQSLLDRADALLRGYWGVFGWNNVPADEIYYTVARVLLVAALGGLLMMIARGYWRRIAPQPYLRSVEMLATMAAPVVVIMAVLAVAVPGLRANGRALYILIAVNSILIYVGLSGWFSSYRMVLAGALALLCLGLSVAVPFRTIQAAYTPSPVLSLESIPQDVHEMDVSFADDLFLVGYTVRPESVQAGDDVQVTLYWAAQRKTAHNYAVALNLVGYKDEAIGAAQSYPGGGNAPTSLWLPGQVIRDVYTIHVAADADAPTAAGVVLTVRDGAGGDVVAARAPQGNELEGQIEIARLRVEPQRAAAYRPEVSLSVDIGDQIQLNGFDLSPIQPERGQPWEVTLYWRSLQAMPADYTVFVHLVDADGNIVAQGDSPPLDGHYPTSLWPVGETVRDPHQIDVPADLPAGLYELRVGIYRLDTGERLPVVVATPTPEGMAATAPAPVAGLTPVVQTSTTLGAFEFAEPGS